MTVRQAIEQDINQIVLLGEALVNESPSYRLKAFSAEKVNSFLQMVISDPNYQCLVADDNGQLIGYFIGALTYEWYSDEITAFDFSIYILPNKRNGRTAIKFLTAFEQWAKSHNANYFRIGISTAINTNNISKFYQSLGFKADGLVFEKRL